jgi:hypothetical protein
MLLIVEGTVHVPLSGEDRRAASAWLGPMADGGFLHGGWVDHPGTRVWMVVSATDETEAQERLADLPAARDGSVSFTVTLVEALRLS